MVEKEYYIVASGDTELKVGQEITSLGGPKGEKELRSAPAEKGNFVVEKLPNGQVNNEIISISGSIRLSTGLALAPVGEKVFIAKIREEKYGPEKTEKRATVIPPLKPEQSNLVNMIVAGVHGLDGKMVAVSGNNGVIAYTLDRISASGNSPEQAWEAFLKKLINAKSDFDRNRDARTRGGARNKEGTLVIKEVTVVDPRLVETTAPHDPSESQTRVVKRGASAPAAPVTTSISSSVEETLHDDDGDHEDPTYPG